MIDTKQTGGVTRDVVEGREYTELMLGGNRKNAKLQQYLANDRKVLRFQCFWDPYPVFYKRSPLRKNPLISPTPGTLEPEHVIYKPHDLIVGEAIDIYGRKIVIY